MICATRTPGQVLSVSRLIATTLAAEAMDPDVDLTMAERRALVAISLAVDAEASRRDGVEPVAGVRDVMTERLTAIEAGR